MKKVDFEIIVRKINTSTFKQFVLTCEESKTYNETGEVIHPYGGIGYTIKKGADGLPHVVNIQML